MRVTCHLCKIVFYRSTGRYNEATKMGWHQFCSPACQARYKNTHVSCKCVNCGKKFEKTPSQIKIVTNSFCSRGCAAIYNNQLRSKFHVCLIAGCNNQVKGAKKYCSSECLSKYQKKSKYTSGKVLGIIRDFADSMGRIPTRNELGHINRLARKYFGTWNKAVVAAGYDPNPMMFARHHIARDGHKCDSLAEKLVDDWMYARNIVHKVHYKYPWNNGMKCDFLVGNWWIEIFGLAGELRRYDKLKTQKLKLIKKYKLKLTKLTLKDVYCGKLETKLRHLVGNSHRPS